MNARQTAIEVIEKLKRSDGVVFTNVNIIEAALINAFNQGIEHAASYTAAEIGQEKLATEILSLAKN
jgi:hypothetical protein